MEPKVSFKMAFFTHYKHNKKGSIVSIVYTSPSSNSIRSLQIYSNRVQSYQNLNWDMGQGNKGKH